MGFFQKFFQTKRMNADPEQQALAELLIDHAEGPLVKIVVMNWLEEKGWPNSEAGDRLIHALSMVKIARPDVYIAAKAAAHDIYVNELR